MPPDFILRPRQISKATFPIREAPPKDDAVEHPEASQEVGEKVRELKGETRTDAQQAGAVVHIGPGGPLSPESEDEEEARREEGSSGKGFLSRLGCGYAAGSTSGSAAMHSMQRGAYKDRFSLHNVHSPSSNLHSLKRKKKRGKRSDEVSQNVAASPEDQATKPGDPKDDPEGAKQALEAAKGAGDEAAMDPKGKERVSGKRRGKHSKTKQGGARGLHQVMEGQRSKGGMAQFLTVSALQTLLHTPASLPFAHSRRHHGLPDL